jgi:hypothetical protein
MPDAPQRQRIDSAGCGDARERFPALLRGRATLTDYALVEAHLTLCAECRRVLKQLQQSAQGRSRRRQRLSRCLTLIALAAVTVVLGLAVAAYLVYRLPNFRLIFGASPVPLQSVVARRPSLPDLPPAPSRAARRSPSVAT